MTTRVRIQDAIRRVPKLGGAGAIYEAELLSVLREADDVVGERDNLLKGLNVVTEALDRVVRERDHLKATVVQERASALREAADAWQQGKWSEGIPPGANRPALILGMAQRAADFLRERADRIERGDA